MWSAEQKKGLLIVLVGHVLYGVSRSLVEGETVELGARIVGALAAVAMVAGSALYVRGKGYAAVWGLGGFLPFIGIGTLLLIPAFPAEEREEARVAPGEGGG